MYKRILVPVDGSDTSNKALVAAMQIARESGGMVRLLNAFDELAYVTGTEYTGDVLRIAHEQSDKVLEDGLAMARSAGVDADTHLVNRPGQRLGQTVAEEAQAWDADLIVVGTHGRRGVARVLLGSGAEQIIRMAPVPTLVIRGEERQASEAG